MTRRTQSKVAPHTPCGYCFSEWATGWDHLVPWSYRPDDSAANRYPSCKRCNCLLYNKMFATLREKREYVREELIRRGEWKLPELWQELPQEEGAPEILRGILPLEGLGSTKPPQQAPRTGAPNSAAPVLVWDASKVRGRRRTEMRKSRRDAKEAQVRMEAALASDAEGINSGAGEIDAKRIQCAWKECMTKFLPEGRQQRLFCSASCRAKASDEAQFKRRLAHKQPMQTAERRAIRAAAVWLGAKQ